MKDVLRSIDNMNAVKDDGHEKEGSHQENETSNEGNEKDKDNNL